MSVTIDALLIDALFSAIAAAGFAVISNPPIGAVLASAALSAIGHSFRYYLIHALQLDIATATFFAAALIGFLSLGFAKYLRIPNEVMTFPSLLPMIPGMYSYRMILALSKFIRSDDAAQYTSLIENAFSNGLTAVFIMLALVIGVSLPVMMFRKESYSMTRGRRSK